MSNQAKYVAAKNLYATLRGVQDRAYNAMAAKRSKKNKQAYRDAEAVATEALDALCLIETPANV